MVESKSSCTLKVNKLKNSTGKTEGQATKYKKYRSKKTQTKSQGPERKAKTNFKGCWNDLEGYIFDLGPKSL